MRVRVHREPCRRRCGSANFCRRRLHLETRRRPSEQFLWRRTRKELFHGSGAAGLHGTARSGSAGKLLVAIALGWISLAHRAVESRRNRLKEGETGFEMPKVNELMEVWFSACPAETPNGKKRADRCWRCVPIARVAGVAGQTNSSPTLLTSRLFPDREKQAGAPSPQIRPRCVLRCLSAVGFKPHACP